MRAYPEAVIITLCERLRVQRGFLVQCLEESVVEVQEIQGHWDLSNGTALRLRRLERLCRALNVDVPTAKLILDLTQRVADLEEEVRRRDPV
jgi:hypothetical protein